MSYNYQSQRDSDRDGNQYRKEQFSSSNRNDDRDTTYQYRKEYTSRDTDNNRDNNWNISSRGQQSSSTGRDWKSDKDDSYMRQVYRSQSDNRYGNSDQDRTSALYSSRDQDRSAGDRDRNYGARDRDDMKSERVNYWQQTKTYHNEPNNSEFDNVLFGKRNEASFNQSSYPQQYNQNQNYQSRSSANYPDQSSRDQCDRHAVCGWGNNECNRSQSHEKYECARPGQSGQYNYDNRNEYSQQSRSQGPTSRYL